MSAESKKPVRVIRGFKCKSKYAPAEGYRYDGLYVVESAWREPGLNPKGFLVCKFALRVSRRAHLFGAWLMRVYSGCLGSLRWKSATTGVNRTERRLWKKTQKKRRTRRKTTRRVRSRDYTSRLLHFTIKNVVCASSISVIP
jgi:hypothetical protein